MTRSALVRRLAGELDALCDEQPFQVGWYLKDLRSGCAADRLGDAEVPSASTRKLPILMAALAAVADGRLKLDSPVTIDERHRRTTSGIVQHLSRDLRLTLRDALVLMIVVSDNACTSTVGELLGLDELNDYSTRVGMRRTRHRFVTPPRVGRDHSVLEANTTTPGDLGLLLELIVRGATDAAVAAELAVTTDLCRLAIDILLGQQLTGRLPALLPTAARVAHKTGRGTAARNNHDAGIVFHGDDPLFVLVVLTESLPVDMPDGTSGYNRASRLIAQIAKSCYGTLASG